jgi:hypothetical protein
MKISKFKLVLFWLCVAFGVAQLAASFYLQTP